MAGVKPIIIDQGDMKEMGSSDVLPNQTDIEELREIVAFIVLELVQSGFEIENKKVLTLLKFIK